MLIWKFGMMRCQILPPLTTSFDLMAMLLYQDAYEDFVTLRQGDLGESTTTSIVVCKFSLFGSHWIYLAYFLQVCVFLHMFVYCFFNLHKWICFISSTRVGNSCFSLLSIVGIKLCQGVWISSSQTRTSEEKLCKKVHHVLSPYLFFIG